MLAFHPCLTWCERRLHSYTNSWFHGKGCQLWEVKTIDVCMYVCICISVAGWLTLGECPWAGFRERERWIQQARCCEAGNQSPSPTWRVPQLQSAETDVASLWRRGAALWHKQQHSGVQLQVSLRTGQQLKSSKMKDPGNVKKKESTNTKMEKIHRIK